MCYELTGIYGDCQFQKTFRNKALISKHYKELKDRIGLAIALGYRKSSGDLTDLEKAQIIALFQHHHSVPDFQKSTYAIGINKTKDYVYVINGLEMSYTKAVSGIGKDLEKRKNENAVKNFHSACRHSILDQITAARKHFQGLNQFGNDDVIDHVIFFNELVRDWLVETGHKINQIGISNEFPYNMDEPYCSSWKEYHRKHAILRPLNVIENCKRQPKNINWNLYLF